MVFGSAFAGFFVLIDPLGGVPIFASITKECSFEAQIILAFKAVLVSTLMLTTFILMGASTFEYFGILPAVFKLAGGLLLFSFSGSLLASNSEKANKDIEEQEEPVVAVAELRPSPSTDSLLKKMGSLASCLSNPQNSPALAPHRAAAAAAPPSPVLTPHQALAAAALRLQQQQVQLDGSPASGAPLDLTDLNLGLSHGTDETGAFNAVQPPATSATTSSEPVSRTPSSPPLTRSAKLLVWAAAFPTAIRSKDVRDQVEDHMGAIIFPMATPLMAGPGAIAFSVLITEIAHEDASGHSWVATLEVLSAMLSVMLICFIVFSSSRFFVSKLGENFARVAQSVVGILVAAIGVQYIYDGFLTLVILSLEDERLVAALAALNAPATAAVGVGNATLGEV